MKRSKHSLSNYKLLSGNMGDLIPIGLTEVLPGDSIQQNTNCFVRVAPMVAPIMHPVDVRIHHWFVPTRLIWDDFENFITGGPDGMNASVPPYIDTLATTQGFLPDYMGVPPSADPQRFSALPFRAYNMIWNEWYRDQDLQTALPIAKTSGADATTTAAQLMRCAWEKDYFTTARPWASKGPDIVIPTGESNIVGDGSTPSYNIPGGGAARPIIVGTGSDHLFVNGGNAPTTGSVTIANSGLELDTDAVNINALREAFALQRYQEARARYGSRYTEYLRYLGIKSSDSRLQRPEFLGGGKQKLQFSEVLATAEGTDTDVGDMAGHGIGAARTNRFRRFFEEHGYVITLMSVRPKTIYVQGLPRMFSRQTKEDYFQKELQHIGQQTILNKELYYEHTTPEGTFGFQDRYDEYRRQESSVAGEFRDQLDYWHMARKFSSDPTLNGSFINCLPTDRIYAATTTDQLYIMANHSIQARRMVTSSGGNSYVY